MSLSRILNDEPVEPIQPVQVPAPVPVRQVEPAFVDTYRRSPPSVVSESVQFEGPRSRNTDRDANAGERGGLEHDWSYGGPSGTSSKRVSPAHSRGPAPDDALPHSRARERVYESMEYDGREPTEYPPAYPSPHPANWQNGSSVHGPEPVEMSYPDQEQPQSGRASRQRSATYREEESNIESSRKKRRTGNDADLSHEGIPQQNGQNGVSTRVVRLLVDLFAQACNSFMFYSVGPLAESPVLKLRHLRSKYRFQSPPKRNYILHPLTLATARKFGSRK